VFAECADPSRPDLDRKYAPILAPVRAFKPNRFARKDAPRAVWNV
jgi:hypothetical protein